MAVTIIGQTGYQWGVEADETGINIESFEGTYRPEQSEFLRDKVGTKIGKAVDQVEGEFSVEGEVSGSSGLMAATFTAAVTLANDDDEFGLNSGSVLLDEVTIGQNRQGFRRASFRLSKNKGVTAS